MSYIRREALPEKAEWNPFDDYSNGWNDCLALIKAIPAADVREVRWGRWETDTCHVYCSVCGKHEDYKTNYCPNCGAVMEKTE